MIEVRTFDVDEHYCDVHCLTIGGIVHRKPVSLTLCADYPYPRGGVEPAWLDESGDFWSYDNPAVRERILCYQITTTQ